MYLRSYDTGRIDKLRTTWESLQLAESKCELVLIPDTHLRTKLTCEGRTSILSSRKHSKGASDMTRIKAWLHDRFFSANAKKVK